MNDDLFSGAGRLPEKPVAGPPVVPPPIEPTDRSEPADGWRWFHAALAFVGGFVASQMLVLALGIIWTVAAGTKLEALDDDSTFVVIASALNEIVFIASAYVVARMAGPARLRDFGLRKAPFWPTVGRMAVVLIAYYALLAAWSSLVDLAPDSAPEKLGASESTLHMLFFALLVGVLAPIAEEFFFRGMIYRALINGLGVFGAAIVSGLLFGVMHIDSATSERLLQVVPLAVLGIAFALLYSWSGTLYAPIALHATNNAIAVAAYADKHNSDFGLVLSGVIWLLMMVGCALAPRLTDRDRGGRVEYALTQ